MAGEPAAGRVLIADDDPHVREMLREFLAGRGYEVATAATGGQAIDAVRIFQPDVILIDRLMPNLSGTDVLDALRQAGVTVPVILISGQQITVRKGSSSPPQTVQSTGDGGGRGRRCGSWADLKCLTIAAVRSFARPCGYSIAGSTPGTASGSAKSLMASGAATSWARTRCWRLRATAWRRRRGGRCSGRRGRRSS